MVRPSNVVKRSTIKYGLILVTSQQKAIFKQLVSQITTKKISLTSTLLDIKVYDGITGADVTDKFDIKVENGVLYGTSKAGLTKAISATDATPVIDTTKFEFGRYYNLISQLLLKTLMLTTV